jgi:hypothetical protein
VFADEGRIDMRYRETGEVHKDFHLTTETTVQFVLKKYGIGFLRELFRRTAQNVYKDIYEHLKKGDYEPLLEHWSYFYEREGGEFTLNRGKDEVVFHVLRCPSIEHLKARGVEVKDSSYLPTILLNDGWSEGTPFKIDTLVKGEGEYDCVIRRRATA